MKHLLLLLAFIASIFLNIHAQCWKAIVAGNAHMLAIKKDGTLWATGYALLGDATTNSQTHFIQIGVDNNWQSVSASEKVPML